MASGCDKKGTMLRVWLVVILVLSLGFGFQKAFATPLLGQPVYYEGGSVEVTVLPFDATYTNTLYLFLTNPPSIIASNVEVGKAVNLGNLASLGVAVGDELVFGIAVAQTGNIFLTGPASRNFDNVAHATVDYTTGSDVAVLQFEDLWGGGDKDYNDANFLITGINLIAPPRVPEPASVILLIFGLAGVVCVSRCKKNRLPAHTAYPRTSLPQQNRDIR